MSDVEGPDNSPETLSKHAAWLWNQNRWPGTPVRVRSTGFESETRTTAIAKYGEAVVWLKGDPVAHVLDDLEVLVVA